VPELEVDLPATAIGKDYLRDKLVDSAPSGRGKQFSLAGLLGVTASSVEGFELNVLGLTFGVNPFNPAIKLAVRRPHRRAAASQRAGDQRNGREALAGLYVAYFQADVEQRLALFLPSLPSTRVQCRHELFRLAHALTVAARRLDDVLEARRGLERGEGRLFHRRA